MKPLPFPGGWHSKYKDTKRIVKRALIKQGFFVSHSSLLYLCSHISSTRLYIEKITLPDFVTSIGEGVFENRTSLKAITIPDSVTTVGIDAFVGCRSLKEINCPESVIIEYSMGGGCCF